MTDFIVGINEKKVKVLIDGPYFMAEINLLKDVGVDLQVLRKFYNEFSQITWYTNTSNRLVEWLRHNQYRVKVRTHERHYLFDMVSELVRLEFAYNDDPVLIITGELGLLPNMTRLRETRHVTIISNNSEFIKHADCYNNIHDYLNTTNSLIARNFDQDHLRKISWVDYPNIHENPSDLIHNL